MKGKKANKEKYCRSKANNVVLMKNQYIYRKEIIQNEVQEPVNQVKNSSVSHRRLLELRRGGNWFRRRWKY